MESRKRAVIFHMAQVLTGHGCFGEYLCRIGKERVANSYHCVGGTDTADHTLAVCTAWEDECRQLKEMIGNNLSLPAVIEAITTEEDTWKAFATFCGKVMRQKEDAERIRRGEQPPSPFAPWAERTQVSSRRS